jgi:hypothetical protein
MAAALNAAGPRAMRAFAPATARPAGRFVLAPSRLVANRGASSRCAAHGSGLPIDLTGAFFCFSALLLWPCWMLHCA